jgi:hypothetical protein
MRLLSLPSTLTTALLLQPITASIIPTFLASFEDLQNVRKRCDNPCGYYGQLCCESGETCYTDSNNQAQCGPAPVPTNADGSWQYLTTTYVMTDEVTITTTLSWQVTPTPEPCNTCNSCEYSLGETPCGSMCCKSGQYCQQDDMCVAVGGDSSGNYGTLFTVTTINTVTAPARPTSDLIYTITQTGGEVITTTQAYITPTGTGGAILTGPQAENSGGGLSGGAIAGIVIGVIAGIIILLLICICCCAKGLIDGILGIFGLGPRRKRREETEVYERHSHHHHGSRTGGRTWFGTRPRRGSRDEKKSGGGWGTFAGVSAALGGLALLLGMKRKRDRRDEKSSSGYGSSYYSDYTSSEFPLLPQIDETWNMRRLTGAGSESSSDRRTRRSSRSRSRASRAVSRTSRR